MNTVLGDRVLWFDGTYTIKSGQLESFLKRKYSGALPCVDEITPDIRAFNKLLPPAKQIHIKEKNNELVFDWDLPKSYANMDVQAFVLNKFIDECVGFNDSDINIRQQRVLVELRLFKKRKMMNILKTMVHIVDKFEEHDIVWGIGRGSSVASYVLYLIGIHDVDSVKYHLNLLDFFKSS